MRALGEVFLGPLWVRTLLKIEESRLSFYVRVHLLCGREGVYAAVLSHLMSQVGCGNERVAHGGLRTSR